MSTHGSSHSFVVYIDESGDEGFVFRDDPLNKGSSRWFVMSAVVFHAQNELEEVKRIDAVKTSFQRDVKKALHFVDLPHDKRVAFAKAIARSRMLIISVLVHKPSLYPGQFSAKHRLYWYISKFVLERVSWLCRDRFNDKSLPQCPGDGSARVVFSDRRTMAYETLREYLRTLQAKGEQSIDWGVIAPEQIESVQHEALRGLQIADLAASAFFCAVEPSRFGHTEDRYARELIRRVYKWSDGERRLGVGVKVWPSEAIPIFTDVCDLLEY